jgi:endo-1,4-beta-xylanase
MKVSKVLFGLVTVASLFAFSCESAPAAKAAPAKAAEPAKTVAKAEPAKPTGKTLDVTKGTPTIDGEIDDAWKAATVIKTESKAMGTSVAYINARLLWDEKFLYVLAEVSDPVLSDKSPNVWEQDSIEMVIDQNNGKTGAYQADDAQYRVGYKGGKSFGGNAVQAQFQSAAKIVTGGYIIEAAIPLNKVPGAAGNVMGFDIQINEDDGKGTRSGILCWNDTTNTNYQSTKNYGTITLK